MLDTLKLLSPRLGAAQLIECRRSLGQICRTDSDGVLEYQFFSGSLAGSYDHRISVKVDESRGALVIEGSVHKAIQGDNVLGGPEDLLSASRWFVDLVAGICGVPLPDGGLWLPRRIDWAEAFLCGSLDSAKAVMASYQRAEMPRRRPSKHSHGETGVSFTSDRNFLTLYLKGPEFRKHDAPRLRKAYAAEIAALAAAAPSGAAAGADQFDESVFLALDQLGIDPLQLFNVSGTGKAEGDQLLMFDNPSWFVDNIQTMADCIVRVEVRLLRRALTDASWYHGDKTTVQDISNERIVQEWSATVDKMTKESKSSMEKVVYSLDVNDRLREFYSDKDAEILHGTYLRLAAHGERQTLAMMKRSTFYLHKQKLLACGVDWTRSDVKLCPADSLIPSDWSLSLESPYRVTGESLEVRRALSPYRVA